MSTYSSQSTGNSRTGTPNDYYDLVSIMYHALQGAQTCEKYANDAHQQGDQELAQFFRQVQQEDKNRANRAKQLFAQRVGHSQL